MTTVCPRTGRSPWRRRKNCVLIGVVTCVLFVFAQFIHFEDDTSPLHPLHDAKNEALRLLKLITHYHYQCNNTVQFGNRTHWPLCIDKDVGFDIDHKGYKLLYYIGTPKDNHEIYGERSLALNHSFHVYFISHKPLAANIRIVNNTHYLQTVLVPNDFADFSRNSYGQQTLNNLMHNLGHTQIDVLKLADVSPSVQMWELLHFMIYDNLLYNVKQIHISMYIDKIEKDFLYNWYESLYKLFTQEGFRLYHTNSDNSLCIQVTMMQSCVYYMSWIRITSPTIFILQPPAYLGGTDHEEQRLWSSLTATVQCKQRWIGGRHEDNRVSSSGSVYMPEWLVCTNNIYQLFERQPCSVVRLRSGNDHVLEKRFLDEGCDVYSIEPIYKYNLPPHTFRIHTHHVKRSNEIRGDIKGVDDVLSLLQSLPFISLLELDVQDHEWHILTQILDSGILKSVNQMVLDIRLISNNHGHYASMYRHHYSELYRLTSQQLHLHSATHSFRWLPGSQLPRSHRQKCCYKLSYVKSGWPSR